MTTAINQRIRDDDYYKTLAIGAIRSPQHGRLQAFNVANRTVGVNRMGLEASCYWDGSLWIYSASPIAVNLMLAEGPNWLKRVGDRFGRKRGDWRRPGATSTPRRAGLAGRSSDRSVLRG